MAEPSGSAQAVTILGLRSFSAMETPARVPPVPTEQMNPSTLPSVCSQISGPVPSSDGSAIHSWIKTGELKAAGDSITEGIGQGRVTSNLEGAPVDDAFNIPDTEALPVIFDLLREEGLCMGGSTGINLAGAVRLARQMGPGHRIVTILCDFGSRYQSKLFNPAFLKSKRLPFPDWL